MRLLSVHHPAGGIETSIYFATGLRESYANEGGSGRNRLIYDRVNVVLEKLTTGTIAVYTQNPQEPGGLRAAKAGADHRFYVPDMQGHVRQVTDIDGDAIAEYQYDAWGLIQLTAASAMAFGDWGYTWDGKPGRYYVQQRHLRADLGRWMSVDPVETEPPYAYVGNRPTWGVDLSGEQGSRQDSVVRHRTPDGLPSPDNLVILGQKEPKDRRKGAVPEPRGAASRVRPFVVVLDVLPDIGTDKVIRKGPELPGIMNLDPRNAQSALTAAQHALGYEPSGYISASPRPFGAANMVGQPMVIDLAGAGSEGEKVTSTQALVAALRSHARQHPEEAARAGKLISVITQVEREMLIEGTVDAERTTALSPQHRKYVTAAEGMFRAHRKAGEEGVEVLAVRLSGLESQYRWARTAGPAGRGLTVIGVAFSLADLGAAVERSVEKGSVRPAAAEVVRQVGGWAGALGGAKVGFLAGGTFGIETGPGALAFAVVGSLAGGVAGYLGANVIAGEIEAGVSPRASAPRPATRSSAKPLVLVPLFFPDM